MKNNIEKKVNVEKKKSSDNISPKQKKCNRKTKSKKKNNNTFDTVIFADILSKLGVPITTLPDGSIVTACPVCTKNNYDNNLAKKVLLHKHHNSSLLTEGYELKFHTENTNYFQCENCEFSGDIFAFVLMYHFIMSDLLCFETALNDSFGWFIENYNNYSLLKIIMNNRNWNRNKSNVCEKMYDFIDVMVKNMVYQSVSDRSDQIIDEILIGTDW